MNPQICPNLNTDHSKLLEIYHAVDALPGIKKSFIGSGVRYDLLLHKSKDEKVNQAAREYTRELITKHVSGRLKVAPEHTSPEVLKFMRKPSFDLFYEFKRIFDKINKEEGLNQQIIPYFISSHPGCHEEDMAELAVITKGLDFHLEQVQDFTPTPMTISTETWYTGYDPYTLEPVFSAKTQKEKLAQRMFFFWYKPEERRAIESELRRIGRTDLIDKLYDKKNFGGNHGGGFKGKKTNFDDKAIGSTYDNPGVGRGAKGKRGAGRNAAEPNGGKGRGRNAADRFAPKGYGNVGCYDEEKYLNEGRPLNGKFSRNGQSLIDNYKANKEAYDLANADATALVYLSKAGEMIKDNNAKLTGVTGDFGNQADAINASKADLQAELAKVQADYDKAAAEYKKVNNYD